MFEAAAIVFWCAAGLLLYTLLVYPVLVNLARGGDKPCPEPPAQQWPMVSLIIPAHNEEQILTAKLENALSLEYPPERLEIIVASDGSSDGTVSIARQFAGKGVRVLDVAHWRGKACILNDAVQQARGEVLCFCDANVMFRPDALRKLVSRLREERVGAVSGDVRLQSDESNFGRGERLYYRLERWLQRGETRFGSMMGVDGGMYVLRRELFRPLPADTILDDLVLSMQVIRQRQRVVYEPAAIATENGTPQARQEFRRRLRVAAGAVQSVLRGEFPPLSRPVLLWQYASHKLLRWLGPLWLLLLLVANVLLVNQAAIYQLTLAAQAAVYLLAGCAVVSIRFRQTTPGGIPFYIVLSHLAMGMGLLLGLFRRQRGQWQRTERLPASSTANQELQLTKNVS